MMLSFCTASQMALSVSSSLGTTLLWRIMASVGCIGRGGRRHVRRRQWPWSCLGTNCAFGQVVRGRDTVALASIRLAALV